MEAAEAPSCRRNVFSACVICEWNALPPSAVTAPSFNAFKARLDRHWPHLKYSTHIHDWRRRSSIWTDPWGHVAFQNSTVYNEASKVLPDEGWWNFSPYGWGPGYNMDIKYFIYLSNVGEGIAKIINKLSILASLSKYSTKVWLCFPEQIIDLSTFSHKVGRYAEYLLSHSRLSISWYLMLLQVTEFSWLTVKFMHWCFSSSQLTQKEKFHTAHYVISLHPKPLVANISSQDNAGYLLPNLHWHHLQNFLKVSRIKQFHSPRFFTRFTWQHRCDIAGVSHRASVSVVPLDCHR